MKPEYFRVCANISLDAIRDNIKSGRALLPSGTKMMGVVKADAYGHGAVPVAKAIEDLVEVYGVSMPEEGVELRKAGLTKPIVILGYTAPEIAAILKKNPNTVYTHLTRAREMLRDILGGEPIGR